MIAGWFDHFQHSLPSDWGFPWLGVPCSIAFHGLHWKMWKMNDLEVPLWIGTLSLWPGYPWWLEATRHQLRLEACWDLWIRVLKTRRPLKFQGFSRESASCFHMFFQDGCGQSNKNSTIMYHMDPDCIMVTERMVLWSKYPIGSMYAIYMVTFTSNIPQMLAYIPYMDPMGNRTTSRPTNQDFHRIP